MSADQISYAARNQLRLERIKYLYAVYMRYALEDKWFPIGDVHGNVTTYSARKDAEHRAGREREFHGKNRIKVVRLFPQSLDSQPSGVRK